MQVEYDDPEDWLMCAENWHFHGNDGAMWRCLFRWAAGGREAWGEGRR